MGRRYGVEQAQGQSQAGLPVPPAKAIEQKRIHAGPQAIDQHQDRVLFPGNFHQAIVKQVKEGEPLLSIRSEEVLSERTLRHLDEGRPIVDNIKKTRSPEDYYRHSQQHQQHQDRVPGCRSRFCRPRVYRLTRLYV